MNRTFRVAVLSIVVSFFLSGCMTAATTMAGIGGSAAFNHRMTGISQRTFTAPESKVKRATFRALNRMKIAIVSKGQKDQDIYLISAKTAKRNIEVQIEPISKNATRISVKAKESAFVYDSATANEIVQQTKRQLG